MFIPGLVLTLGLVASHQLEMLLHRNRMPPCRRASRPWRCRRCRRWPWRCGFSRWRKAAEETLPQTAMASPPLPPAAEALALPPLPPMAGRCPSFHAGEEAAGSMLPPVRTPAPLPPWENGPWRCRRCLRYGALPGFSRWRRARWKRCLRWQSRRRRFSLGAEALGIAAVA